MKILLVNQFFHPDVSATAQLATDLADDLAASGHEVSVLAARGAYLGGGRLRAEERRGSVRIRRVFATSFGKSTIARRLIDYGTFLLAALVALVTMPRPDVTVAMSTPPLVAAMAGIARALRGGRLVYWVQDVYPDLAEALGVLRPGSMTGRALEVVSRWTLRRADSVVVLGQAMASRLASKGVPRDNITIIPNWADESQIRPLVHAENPFRAEHGLSGRIVLYSGNMGLGHDLATLLGAAEQLRAEPSVTFLFIGDGARREEVSAAALNNPAIRLLPYQPRERLAESLSAADVHVATQCAATAGMLELSKLYGVMAAGRPVLYVGPAGTEVARTVREEAIGAVVANGDVDGAVRALRALLSDPEPLGASARAACEREYGRLARTTAFAAVLQATLRR